EEHKKLSKRSGHSSFEDLIDQGFLPEAVLNFVALLGWSPEDNREIMSLDELVEKFDYRKMSKSQAVFDFGKLRWMNGEYLKAMDPERFYQMALPYLSKTLTRSLDLKKIAGMVQSRIETFEDIAGHVDFFEELPDYGPELYIHKKMKSTMESSLTVLEELLPVLEKEEDYSNDALYRLFTGFAEKKGLKNGTVLWPVRTALSGKIMTPGGATELMELLGKEESIRRIQNGIEKLRAAEEPSLD
ncbi:MAG: glutamate--tRNA ligase, partial [Lachnospiraceae bacterium]|nr:glutamate--tRNA ligase [Lachnospiraceae bacterium]